MLSFHKFDLSYVQSQLLAVLAPGGEKAGQMHLHSRCRRLQPLGRLAQGNGLDFALDAPRAPRFNLFRLVRYRAFHYRHGGRRVTQRLARDQDSGEFNAVQLSLNYQAAGAASASVSTGASSRTSIIDFDFSSFIIGDGVVIAFFILMVR